MTTTPVYDAKHGHLIGTVLRTLHYNHIHAGDTTFQLPFRFHATDLAGCCMAWSSDHLARGWLADREVLAVAKQKDLSK